MQSMSEVLASKLFSNDFFSVDIVQCGCKLFFRAADVTRALGYGNSSQAVRKNVRNKHVYSREALDDLLGGLSSRDGGVSLVEIPPSDEAALYLSEPGLYELLLKSRKREAEAFQDWVCEDILPQLRQTGSYHTNRKCHNKLQLQLMNEADLHHKVVDFIRTFHPEALLVAGLGENQDSDAKRIDSWRKGYTKGQCDLMVMNRSARWSGLAFEFKTPANTGRVSLEQRHFMDELAKAGFRVLISNSYDEICNEIRDYFRATRVLCHECGKWIRTTAWEGHVHTHIDMSTEQQASHEAVAVAEIPDDRNDLCPF